MEIPYTVSARQDTGLWNAKIGIWLFLASEVMLFGGLFSAYIFLRLGAGSVPGYVWPMHVLNVPLGFVNTLVLIGSSVTVILSWAALKLGEWKNFKLWMGLTLALSLTFLVIKSFEYKAKFTHYGVFLKSGEVITGHHLHAADDHLTIVPDEGHGHGAAKGGHGETGKADAAAGHGAEKADAGHATDPATLKGVSRQADGSLRIEKSEVFRYANHGPKYNTFYAIYFTLTGLHALHVIGGALVLGYFFFRGHVLYQKAPEHLANRVEVGGLFWHFVDLVWIFLFPLLYLL